MDFLINLLKGVAVGLAVSIPVGPTFALFVRRAVLYGRRSAIVSGLGAATADFIAATLAVFALSAVTIFVVRYEVVFHLFGSAVLLYFGISCLRFGKEFHEFAVKERVGLIGDYVSAFVLTGSNPLTIISMLAIFAGMGLYDFIGNSFQKLTLLGGVFFGSVLWWFTVVFLIGAFSERVRGTYLMVINKVFGFIMLGFAVFLVVSLFHL